MVVITNSLKVPNIKKILLYEISCTKLQLPPEPLTRGLPPPDPCPLSWTEFVEPSPSNKIPGYTTDMPNPSWTWWWWWYLNGVFNEGEFRENRHKEGSNFRMSVNWLHFACAEKPYDIWKLKNVTINSLHCVKRHSTCNLVKYFTNIHYVCVVYIFYLFEHVRSYNLEKGRILTLFGPVETPLRLTVSATVTQGNY